MSGLADNKEDEERPTWRNVGKSKYLGIYGIISYQIRLISREKERKKMNCTPKIFFQSNRLRRSYYLLQRELLSVRQVVFRNKQEQIPIRIYIAYRRNGKYRWIDGRVS